MNLSNASNVGTAGAGLPRRALLGAALAAGAWLAGCDQLEQGVQAQRKFHGQNVTGTAEGKDLRMPDHTGRARSLADFRGKVVMVFFGFTQCPDVCPVSLMRMAEVKKALGAKADRLQVLFVSVDPERDTPEVLAAYMGAFDPAFIALRPPDEAALAQAARDFKVYYSRVPTGGGYTIDHTATAYLFDTQGRLRLLMGHDQTVQDYTDDIAALLQEAGA